MSIFLTDSLKKILVETAFELKGAARRKFMAQTVMELGFGGQRLVERELGWNRCIIRKGIKELKTGVICVDNFSAKGRLKAESHLPNLLSDIKDIVDSQSRVSASQTLLTTGF